MIPAKADISKQEIFLSDTLKPLIEEAHASKRTFFCGRGALFLAPSPYLGILWTLVRVFIKSPSGRKRFNVLGAIDSITHNLITVTNDS
jgi:hypothetical protein